MNVLSNFKKLASAAAFSVLALTISATAVAHNHGKGHDDSKAAMQKDIIDVAVGAGQFNTLAAALKAAGLVDTLRGDGPFTVFAPTDAAFAKLPAGTVESLLMPENKDKLIAVLTYHVVSGKVMASDVVKLKSAATVNGANVKISVMNGGVMVDAANVVKTDIGARNGVIHVIDSVILPN